AKEPASVVGSVCDVANEIAFDVVNEKASDALKNKATDVKKKSVGKGNKSPIDKPKDNTPNPKDNQSKAHSDVVPDAEKHKPNPKQKEKLIVQVLFEVSILRLSNQKVNPDVKSKVVVRVSKSKETPMKRKRIVSKKADKKKKLKGKSKKEDSDSKFETDVVDSFSDEKLTFFSNFLTLFTNTMGKADRLKGKICLDVVRRLRKDSVILDID
nr:hypothetical protein [Tanacetum cinerariifolium]